MHLSIHPMMFVGAAIMGPISAFLAYKKNRNPYLWFFLGCCFGIFGIFAIFLFPPKKASLPKDLVLEKPGPLIHGPTDKFWYYLDPAHKQLGPMSHDALTKAFQSGLIHPTTYVWHEEMPEWKPLKEILRNTL